MKFDTNQTVFLNDYQHEVWQIGIHVVPPEVSLADIAEPKMRDGCSQVYSCTMEMLEDMYDNTADYIETRPLNYIVFAFEWLTCNRRVPNEVQKQKGLYERIIFKLQKFGFAFDGESLKNERYPLFVKYWTKLLNAVKGNKKGIGSVCFCDFRAFAKTYKRTIDDLLRPLSDRNKAYFKQLHEHVISKGAKPESSQAYGLFRYSVAKNTVLNLSNHPALVEIPYLNHCKAGDAVYELERFLSIAEQQPDSEELISYIQKNICVCTGCPDRKEGRKKNDERCGRWVYIRGARRLAAMCHTSISRHHHGSRRGNYTDADLPMLKRMVDIRVLQIDS